MGESHAGHVPYGKTTHQYIKSHDTARHTFSHYMWEDQKEETTEKIILKWTWIDLTQVRDKCRDLVNLTMNLQLPKMLVN
jgi:hypothetical protein